MDGSRIIFQKKKEALLYCVFKSAKTRNGNTRVFIKFLHGTDRAEKKMEEIMGYALCVDMIGMCPAYLLLEIREEKGLKGMFRLQML